MSEGKRLDDVLGKRPKPQRLPNQIEQAILFMRMERVLLVLIRRACKGQGATLKALEYSITRGGSPSDLQAGLAAMAAWRENATKAINDYSAFATDPAAFLAQARSSGRIQEWARFGIA